MRHQELYRDRYDVATRECYTTRADTFIDNTGNTSPPRIYNRFSFLQFQGRDWKEPRRNLKFKYVRGMENGIGASRSKMQRRLKP
jgi:hypothetical protein